MSAIPSVTLNNGVEIPQFGFGVYQIPRPKTAAAVSHALELGYRHIDTAQMYGNEKQVGEAIADSGLDRGELFVTSKLNNNHHAANDALRSFDRTLSDLGLSRIDLFLIHWPLPAVGDFVDTWKAMERIYADGGARAIGVSNFQPHHLRRIHAEALIPPAVNQIELHPYLTQDELRSFDAEHDIATEAYSPLAQGAALNDPTINDLARTYDKTPAQVVLRWQLQLGNIVFPKTVTPDRMRENLDVFDFELSDVDVALISSLNRDERTGADPDRFNWVPQ